MTIFTATKFKVISSMMVMLSATSFPSKSATTLQITGNIKAAACRVNFPTSGVEVNLGQGIHQYLLAAAGSAAPWVGFSLQLTACPETTKSVTMTVNGTPGSVGSDTFINTGTATNLQIQVQNISDSRTLGNGANVTQAVDSANSSVEFSLQARAYSMSGNTTPGTILGNMQVSFTYQ
ncbi:fimbrial protein [Ewingella americana]|uniref:fimbrial protein n=1 Tax=Ewingella americana TaxID=41202 RepID=UPI00163A93A6|nr:fimbrial protein [Ewingella americana]QMV51912.1 type 1 fimbrial protein [Ewingella americana]